MPNIQFRDSWYQYAPPWLTTGNAERYMFTLQYCSDLLCEKMNQAMHIRLPGQGDPSQLPYLANDRALVQGPAEPNAAFVLRLQTAIPDWKLAGSRRAILRDVQAYLTNLQPGVTPGLPMLAIVSGSDEPSTAWATLHIGDAQGAIPSLATISPSNFNWDGLSKSWRSWLILYFASVPTGLSGVAAAVASAANGSLLGRNVSGVWVPGISGTPVNKPWITLTGLSGLTAGVVGQWITLSGDSNAGNNGTFPITQYISASSCIIANPKGVVPNSIPMTWSIASYPWMAPGPVWGAPGFVFGQGQTSTPPVSTGTLFQGVWQPSVTPAPGYGPTLSWGLNQSSLIISSIRSILQTRKSAPTYYPVIVIAFDGANGAPGSAYSPQSSPGSGNPDGSFGSVGKNVGGVWVPTRQITSPFDAYCQGTGSARFCTVENVT